VNKDNEFAVRMAFVLDWAGKNCKGIRALTDRDWSAWFTENTGIPDAAVAAGTPCSVAVMQKLMEVSRDTTADKNKWCQAATILIRISPWLKGRMSSR
jgi:hypothetical protein